MRTRPRPLRTGPRVPRDRTEFRETQAEASRELQLVLDPEFLKPGPAAHFSFTRNSGPARGAIPKPAPSTRTSMSCAILALSRPISPRSTASAPFITARNLAQRLENARHLWQNYPTIGVIKSAISNTVRSHKGDNDANCGGDRSYDDFEECC
ncbi:MAG: hypothetical protein ABW185_23110 [Sedimenticola sp.]